MNDSNMKMISSDFVVGDEEFIRQKVKSDTQLPKTNKNSFIDSLDENGKIVFGKLFEFAEKNKLMFRWGSKGFSLNVSFENGFVALCFGYPPHSVFKQSIYTSFNEIEKKVNNSEKIIDTFKIELEKLKKFENAKSNQKWVITKKYSEEEIEQFLVVIKSLIEQIKNEGLKS